ncbi:MAG: ABC transporter permease [Acidimicrobiales bacterium]
MPEQHDPLQAPPANLAAGAGLIGAEAAARPTGSVLDPAPIGRRWYQGLGWGFWVAVGVVVAWVFLALFASLLPIQNPDATQASCLINASPSAAHLLGCDSDGRDILSRVIYGSRVSLVVGFASIALSLLVGGPLGVVAGYFRGWLDEVLGIVSNVFLSIPGLVLALVIVAYLGNSEFDIVLIIAIVAWPILFRVVRASTIEYSQREYVLAAQALGSKRSRILLKTLLPDIVPSAITYSLVGVALAVVAEGALSFLGQSVGDPIPTWGNMIAAGTDTMPQYASLLLAPAIAMFSFILAINFVGDRLRSTLDVRTGVL